MEELNHYLNWCDQMYTNSPHCQCGAECTNGNYCSGIQTNCYECIKRVHNHRNNKTHYNCDKMLYYYVLKHTYRFGAEIFYELHKLRNDIGKLDDIFIASIGCGPCTELFGAMSIWRTLGKQDASFHFRGFELEQMWQPLMTQACSYFNGSDALANLEDAFAYYQNSQERLDIIVLNYMLSDMFKFHSDSYSQFLDNLVTLVRQKNVRYLLVNDVYLLVSVGASNRLLRCMKDAGLAFKHVKLQYHSLHQYIGQFGKSIAKQPYAMTDASIVSKYEPFSEVNSIQTIIRFQ